MRRRKIQGQNPDVNHFLFSSRRKYKPKNTTESNTVTTLGRLLLSRVTDVAQTDPYEICKRVQFEIFTRPSRDSVLKERWMTSHYLF